MSDNKYLVLARKYRSATLAELIGQEVLVKTLTNAILQERLHHAYIFTGIRGTGKTSTARILAKCFNCLNSDKPLVEPCGQCESCKAIAEDRSMDVIEIDAASNTSVDNVREIIDGAKYKPSMSRYKVYIIDEVHMLSKSAFNAILKTLEEPPPFVKFIFATTEIRKVPLTVLSRCQRFDLARIGVADLFAHFKKISSLENVKIDDAALQIVARAADGSVRDGLSLLDQIIANYDGKTEITGDTAAKILGLSSHAKSIGLFEKLLEADIAPALETINASIAAGADPVAIISDLLEVVHFITRAKIVPDSVDSMPLNSDEKAKITEFSANTSIPVLSRVWQMLLKSFQEASFAPSAATALEMGLIRVSYATKIPTPTEVIAGMQKSSSSDEAKKKLALSHDSDYASAASAEVAFETIFAIIEFIKSNGGSILARDMEVYARFVSYDKGVLKLNFEPDAPRDIIINLNSFFAEKKVAVKVERSAEPGAETAAAAARRIFAEQVAEFDANPILREIMMTFPNSSVAKVLDI
ncbi:MAG: DNA polymerase III subunit gamma/tau [Alphaproteobacteria bacterium]|nr:DNA polymerase III subunit gamma/tau [Alphaproteobacteria bacterium]